MAADPSLVPIPQPPAHLLVGNLFDLRTGSLFERLTALAREYGPIYRLELPGGNSRVVVSSAALVDELCDEARCDKTVGPGLRALNDGPIGHGLFTAETDDPLWRKAHDILMPAFSLDAMRAYHPMMLDIAVQLMLKWERLNTDDTVDVPADMTRLTLDTIALCGFGYRFNSFYRETPHPFVVAMLGALAAAQEQSQQLPVRQEFGHKLKRQMLADQEFMASTVRRIIEERHESGVTGTVNDLLDRMLTGVDRKSGLSLDETNIIAQCITFLVAGHETTSGLLSFALCALVKDPGVLARAYDEVDRVLGTDTGVLPTYAQVHQMPYVAQILDETLRLWPTAPMFNRHPRENVVIGGKYRLAKDETTTILTGMLHRDPAVWGADPDRFDPAHFSPENRARIPRNAYKPFGTGQRACIGRQFALQEAALVLGMLLQRFEFVDFANYQLHVKQTLTIKPDDFHIRLKRRAGRAASRSTAASSTAVPAPATAPAAGVAAAPAATPAAGVDGHHTPLLVLYGSNLGTAEGLAHAIARDATDRGFVATVGALDDHVGALPTEGGVVIVTSSYNGQPPDNAARFCRWLQEPALPADAFAGVSYTVFGCGNRDWEATYQAVPTLVDTLLEKHGARRVYARGEGDARGDFDSQYRAWFGPLWPSLAKAFDLTGAVASAKPGAPRLAIAFVNKMAANPIITSYSAAALTVRANRELQKRDCARPSTRSTRHVEIGLPPGASYRTGDHLGIVPRNGVDPIQRVLRRFHLDPSLYMTLTPGPNAGTHLPVGEPVPLVGVLASRVELQDTATRAQIATLAACAREAAERDALLALAGDDEASQGRYREQVFTPRASVLDLLDRFPSCALPFEAYLEMLPPLRPRYYSISSSPLVAPDVCSITVGVVDAPARSGTGTFKGVCSNYLAAEPGQATIYGFIRHPTIPFHPPENPHLPMIMVGPGTGVAPFRGFLQERAALKQKGVPVGESLLFFGCRDPLQDFLYEDELRAFETAGVTRLQAAFSREPGKPKAYVQQAIRGQGEEVWRLLQNDAVIYVCGDASRMAPDVRQAFAGVFRDRTGASDADAQAWLTGLAATRRYLEDIWASAS
jgi:cytochrome P450 / NADPH-cytochrome P450 reductase